MPSTGLNRMQSRMPGVKGRACGISTLCPFLSGWRLLCLRLYLVPLSRSSSAPTKRLLPQAQLPKTPPRKACSAVACSE